MTDVIVDPAVVPTPQPEVTPEPAIVAPGPVAAATPETIPEPGLAGDWPADWRQKYAGDDPKILKRLERYASPKAALDALFAAQTKISSGELKTALKPNASPEEVAQWREANGIPPAPTGYEISLPSGRVVGEEDKPFVDEFLSAAHEVNMHPTQVNKALDWYLGKQEQVMAEQAALDEESRMLARDELRAEYGPDYVRNTQAALELVPEHIRDDFLVARGPDGVMLGNNPEVIRWLAQTARELNPMAAVVPGSGTNAVQALESELANLKTMMGDRQSEYWKGPKSAALQARYRELIGARQKASARA